MVIVFLEKGNVLLIRRLQFAKKANSNQGSSMTRAVDDLGAHLLGRQPMPHDGRDYKLADFLDAHARMTGTLAPGTTLAELQSLAPLNVWHDIYAFWSWFKAHILNVTPSPPPIDPPTPPAPLPKAKLWQHGPISDQGQTPHCVGFTGLDWGNCLPINDQWPMQQGNAIYYACKVLDGQPNQENGSNSRSLCKVLKTRGRLGAYAFAKSADEAATFILNHGPVGIGVDWYNSDFNPVNNILSLKGGIAGGHEISLIGYDPNTRLFDLLNHWGITWANNGVAKLRHDDLDKLLADGGDCWAGLELPL